MNNNRYILKEYEIDLILRYGSNHERRKNYFTLGNKYREKAFVPNFLNPWEHQTRDDLLNIVVGDSHSEFTTRLFKRSLEKNYNLPTLSLTLHTGPSTLIGSALSSCFYENISLNISEITSKVVKLKKNLRKLNIILSLGEIDVRTKISLESINLKKNYKEVIQNCLKDNLEKKISIFKKLLSSKIKDIPFKIYFQIPPPPSKCNFINPREFKNKTDLYELLKNQEFPALYNLEYRLNIYNYLIDFLKKKFKENSICIIENFLYKKNNILTKDNSFDLCHVSHGEWALINSQQINWLN